MINAWLKALNDKLKTESQLEDRILALKALLISVAARKLLPPFDNVPARGKLNAREFLQQISLTDMEERTMSTVPTRKMKPKTAPDIPKTPQKKKSAPDLANPRVKNDVMQVVVQNMGKVMNAICAEDMEALQEIPPVVEQVETAIITSPHRRLTFPIERYQFTPIQLHDDEVMFQSETVMPRSFRDLNVNETIEDLPDLNGSLYDDDENEELVDVLDPNATTSPQKVSFNRKEDVAQADPRTFAMDSSEFSFIPDDIKAYIRGIVKKELIHWPPILQDLGRGLTWPSQAKHPGELIEFSPLRQNIENN